MLPGTYDIDVVRGDDWSIVWTANLTDETTGAITGQVDWTDCTVAAQVRKTPKATVIELTLNAAFSSTPTDGTITMSAPAGGFPDAGTFAWDLQITDSAGKVGTWLAGAVVVKGDVTR